MDQIIKENWAYVSLGVNIIFLIWFFIQRERIKVYRYIYFSLFDWTSRRLDLVLESARIMTEDYLEGEKLVDFQIDDMIQDDIINAPDEFRKLIDKHVTEMKNQYIRFPDSNDFINWLTIKS